MNRLWVRFSLVIVGAVCLVGLSPALARQFGEPLPPQFIPEVREALTPEQWTAIQEIIQTDVIRSLTTFAIATAIVSLLIGIFLSRSLTAPLQALQDGAIAISEQSLSHRVEVSGTEEIVAVGQAFNQMATQLEQAETLRRNLLADLAHEIRNPLHVVRGNLQAILDDVYPLSKEEIGHLLEETHHLTRLVDDLHELAQAEARQLPLHQQKTNIPVLVKEVVGVMRPTAVSHHITLQTEILGFIPKLKIDTARMRQVLHNLLSNALRHTPDGGRVLVRIEQSQNIVHIQVEDNGNGIAPEHLPHVFDRFYRTDSARSREQGGAGLGLAIVKAITEAHGGTVSVQSQLGQGSQFSVSLPVVLT